MASRAEKLHDQDEPHPDPQALTSNPDESQNSSTGVDYEPHPESSLKITQERQHIIDSISRLYSGSCSEDDMRVYAKEAIYDDPWSYCDSRYKIAGQWYGKFRSRVWHARCSTGVNQGYQRPSLLPKQFRQRWFRMSRSSWCSRCSESTRRG